MELFKILGAQCLAVTSVEEIKDYISTLIEKGTGGYSVAINAEKIMMYSKDPQMKEVIDNSILPTPDGAGAVLGMKLLYGIKCIKLDLPKTIFELADAKKYRVFILGSKEDVNKQACDVLNQKHPGIIIGGRRNGYFEKDEEIIDLIRKSEPQIVITALGSPKQELLFKKLIVETPGVLFIGCGGALDALTGRVKRAPAFFVNNNLEWFYRLMQSPSRIKRQWVLPVFVMKLFLNYLKRGR